ncbi:unnamed protein product [Alopecurus aequalis]
MFAALIAIASVAAANKIYVSSQDLASEEGLRELYQRWYELYRADDRHFGEKENRFASFKSEARAVYELNEGNTRLKYHLNWFADLTQDEFAETFANCSSFDEQESSGTEMRNRHQPRKYYPDNLPLTVDWRRVDGALTSVKQQGRCGSCWAFAAAGAMESVNFLENKSSGPISPCNNWSTATQYPYVGNGSACTMPISRPVMNNSSFYFVEPRDEEMLMDAVTQNPVVVLMVGVNNTQFKEYAGGIYSGPCDANTKGKHQSLLVGYGTTRNDDTTDDPNINYWIVKFAWGESWGEKGYMRLQRGYEADGGICGIMLDPVYTILAMAK